MRIVRKLTNVLPTLPRRRFGIFSGTNTPMDACVALQSAIKKGFSDSSTIGRYEAEFAKTAGTRHAISFGAGRMALYAILKAMDLQPGDEIIIPAFTCVVVPNALIYAGIKPVYADIDPKTFNMDASKIEALVTPRTRAVYLQLTFGGTRGVPEILTVARKHGLRVIEDAAHSLGARVGDIQSGALGDIAFFSTDHSKMIGTLLGGMVTTSDDQLATRVRNIQVHSKRLSSMQVIQMLGTLLFEVLFLRTWTLWLGRGMHVLSSRLGLLFYFNDEMSDRVPSRYPYPCQMPSPFADVGLLELKRLKNNLRHRREIARLCEEKLQWQKVSESELESQSWLRYSFLVKNREEFIQRHRKRFDLGIWFTSIVHGRDRDFDEVGYKAGSCPVAEKVAEHVVNYPTHSLVSLDAIRSTLDENRGWFENQILTSI